MGQYYSAYLCKEDKQPQVFDIWSGAKLCEHSWWKNPMVNYVTEHILENPCVVAWVGDYADAVLPKAKMNVYEAAYGKKSKRVKLSTEFHSGDLSVNDEPYGKYPSTLDGLYLVNHTKKVFLDCDKFYAAMDGKGQLGEGWVMHPLPLLTAIGNGQGGGDYYGVNCGDIGCWALDVISVEQEKPEGYEEVDFVFYE